MYWNICVDDFVVKVIIGLMECNIVVLVDCIDDVVIVVISQIGDQGLIFGCLVVIFVGFLQIVLGFVVECMCVGVMISVMIMGVLIGVGMYDLVFVGGVEYMGYYLIGGNVDLNFCFVVEKMVDFGVFNMGVIVECIFDCFLYLMKECFDCFGMLSQYKVQVVYDVGKIQFDFVFVVIKGVDGVWGLVIEDEGCCLQMMMEDLVVFKMLFCLYGCVIVGILLLLIDGVMMLLLVGGGVVKEFGFVLKMWMVLFVFVGVQLEIMGIGLILLIEKVLKKVGFMIDDIGLFEFNEVFVIQVILFFDYFGIVDDDFCVNQWGGVIVVGYLFVVFGVWFMIQFVVQFVECFDVCYGLIVMCVGFGQGGLVIWENLYYDGKKKK